ncbi:MAG: hypothetical protein RJQ08_11560 [Salinisphaeraceae bacterium]
MATEKHERKSRFSRYVFFAVMILVVVYMQLEFHGGMKSIEAAMGLRGPLSEQEPALAYENYVKPGDQITNGPLWEVDLGSYKGDGGDSPYIGSQVDFSDHSGKWLVLRLSHLGPQHGPDGKQAQRFKHMQHLGRFHRVTRSYPNTEFWVVRMDRHSRLTSEIGGLISDAGARACTQDPSRLCYDRFIYAAAERDSEGYFIGRQLDWLSQVIGSSLNGRATLPRLLVVSPDGKVHQLQHLSPWALDRSLYLIHKEETGDVPKDRSELAEFNPAVPVYATGFLESSEYRRRMKGAADLIRESPFQ